MGLRGGFGVGTAGCLWIGGCSMLWRLGGFVAVVFGNTAEHGARGLLLRYNNYCLSTVNTNQDRFMDYL